jgi:nifR3 family TIM-barrel protein
MLADYWLRPRWAEAAPLLALAPMQDVTDLAFWRLLDRYGAPDLLFTEYFRVYPGSHLNREILRSVTENPSGRPVVAQMIGSDVGELVRTATELQRHPVAGIDLNLGCPAPVVYRKCAGGGLLRDLPRVDAILAGLRQAVQIPLSVKTRIGFASADHYDPLLEILSRHRLDLVTVHGRTVADGYRSPVRYDLIARAVAALSCPVLANGNVSSAAKAREVLEQTGARGLMIGRGSVRNPWLFTQIRQALAGQTPRLPVGRQVLQYVRALYDTTRPSGITESAQVQKMKKYLNYLALGVEPTGGFLHAMRRVETEADLFRLCAEYLDHDRALPLEPFALGLKERDLLAGCHA